MNTDEVRKRFEACMKDGGANFERLARGEPYSNTYIYVQQAFEGFEMGYQQGIKDSEASLELAFNQGYSDGLSDGDSIADSSESRGDWEKSNLYEDLNHD